MTDNEIKCEKCFHKSVCEKKTCAECQGLYCDECELYDLYNGVPYIENCEKFIDADLINRLQADKEALIAGQETLQKALAEKNEEFENQSQNFKMLVSDHRTLQRSFDNLKCLYESEKAKVEKAKEKSIYFAKELQTAKEEIERLSDRNHKCIYLSDDETTEYCVDGPCPKFKTESKIKTEAIKNFADSYTENFITLFNLNYSQAEAARGLKERVVKEKAGDTE